MTKWEKILTHKKKKRKEKKQDKNKTKVPNAMFCSSKQRFSRFRNYFLACATFTSRSTL